jgi:hypothetical protein
VRSGSRGSIRPKRHDLNLNQSLLAADQPLLTHEAEPDRELSTAFELLRISDGRDYGACRSRPKARDTLQVTACLNPMPCLLARHMLLTLIEDALRLTVCDANAQGGEAGAQRTFDAAAPADFPPRSVASIVSVATES